MSNPNGTLRSQWRRSSRVALLLMLLVSLVSRPLPTQAGAVQSPAAQDGSQPPNIVVFLADDMGYSDISAFGSEIPTPNIDSLATNGLKMTNFHTMASCSPTRANLLTGVDNHRNGFGTMASSLYPTQVGHPGYEAVINDRVVTVATLLKDSGYHTFMAGKWHLGNEGGEAGNFWPADRGFERSFALLPGAASNFSDRLGFSAGRPVAAYIEDSIEVPALPADFYSTEFYTNKIISYTQTISDGKPFFAYFAYTAPHGPLHVPPDDTYVQEILSDTVTYNYQAGWDVVRERRFNRLKTLGIIPANLTLPPQWTNDPLGNPIPRWNELTPDQQAYEAKRMAIYAAMMRHLDDNIGRFIQHLKDTGQYANTIFVFQGDNGADDLDRTAHPSYVRWFTKIKVDNSYANIGKVRSFILEGPAWAQVSATPFWAAKATVAEGGIRNAFLVSYQGPNAADPIIPAGTQSAALATVLDLTPTFLDYAGVAHPGAANPGDGQVFAPDGRSLRALWEGAATTVYGPDDYIGFELFGTTNKALISGDGWKVLRLGEVPWGDLGIEHESDQNWKLYNLNDDPSERVDLSAQFPARFRDMQARYRAYEAEVGFVSAYLRDVGVPGQTATYSFPLTNKTAVSDTFTLGCYTTWPCSIATGVNSQPISQTQSVSVTLLPAASISVTLAISVPLAIVPDGSRYVSKVHINSDNDPNLVQDYTVITFVGEVGSAIARQPKSYQMTITNPAGVADTFAVVCASAWPCNLSAANTSLRATLASTLTLSLAANQSKQVQVQVTVPDGTAAGLFDIAKVTSTAQSTNKSTVRAFLTLVEETVANLFLPLINRQ